MNSNINLSYASLLFNYLWLGIFTAIYFVTVDLVILIRTVYFIIIYIMGSVFFIIALVFNGMRTYKSLSKLDSSDINTNFNVNSISNNNYPKLEKKVHATETVFYRIYEVIAALSIYEASKGIIFSIFNINTVVTPLDAFFHNPIEFILFLIFVITSIQFIVRVSNHFETRFSASGELNIYSVLNYMLVLGEAITLLSMGIAVSIESIDTFSLWFIALLVIDYVWIILFKVLRIDEFGFTKGLGLIITSLESKFRNKGKIYQEVYSYWINSNITFIIYLSIIEPLSKGYFNETIQFFYVFMVILLFGTLNSVIVNSKCLSCISE